MRREDRIEAGRATWRIGLLLALVALALSGCFGKQIVPTARERVISLRPGELEKFGVAFITPSTVTGQEEEKQAVALVFAEVLGAQRPKIRVVPLAEVLGAVNRNGLAVAYKRMYDDYRDTGLFSRDILKQVGTATGVRYIAQIKLQDFQQGAKERFGALGFRIVETRYANARVFLQIWDSHDGSIVWEGMEEMVYAHDRIGEKPVTLQMVIEQMARDIISKLP